jgi:Kef-type K+ transport system membrane component KefB/mannitol/fructose-specific phosphotransferase system IIA component (Ntr-type)
VSDPGLVQFLVALAVLLVTARALGELARALGGPPVVGEILAGILLGPTALGRVAPGVCAWMFPQSGTPRSMLEGFTSLAVVLLLVVAGLDVDLNVVRRRGRTALLTSVLGIALPLAGGVALGLVLPDSDLVDPSRRWMFASLIGVALSISALPVIAKTLLDLGLYKTDLGLLVMAAAIADDIVGWLAFALLLGPLRGGHLEIASFGKTLALGALLCIALLVVGRRAMDRLLARLETQPHTAGGRVIAIVIAAALLTAGITQAIGIHAIFGGFLVGVVVGDSPRLTERTHVVIEDFVMHVFAPVLFASLGLRIDFAAAFDLRLCLLFFAVASVAKVVGCSVGARGGGLAWREAIAVGFGLNARGAMGILLALVALDASVIRPQVFVALVVMALGTSLLSGPVMKRLLLQDEPEEDVVALLRRGAFVTQLHARTSHEAITELARSFGSLLTGVKRAARDAVIERENLSPTGLGDEVAIPHSAIEGLERPLLALGRAPHGIDFDAPDGKPAKIVFLLLVPPKAYDEEVRILASIARAVFEEQSRSELLAADRLEDALEVLARGAKRVIDARRSTRPMGAAGL